MSKPLRLGILCVWAVVLFSASKVHSQNPEDEFTMFFGLLHSHTSFSDGSGTPKEAFEYARDIAGLDFFAITEHNHSKAGGSDGISLTTNLYKELIKAANKATKNGTFVAIYGQEVSTISAGNHVNIFNAKEICDIENGDFETFYETWLPNHPEVALIQYNHPDFRKDQNPRTKPQKRNNDYGIDDYDQNFSDLVAASAEKLRLIELIIGPAFSSQEDQPHHTECVNKSETPLRQV